MGGAARGTGVRGKVVVLDCSDLEVEKGIGAKILALRIRNAGLPDLEQHGALGLIAVARPISQPTIAGLEAVVRDGIFQDDDPSSKRVLTVIQRAFPSPPRACSAFSAPQFATSSVTYGLHFCSSAIFSRAVQSVFETSASSSPFPYILSWTSKRLPNGRSKSSV